MKSQLEKNNLDKNNTTPIEQARKRKKYSSPKLTKLGLIHEVTLAGGVVPQADSGYMFSPQS